MVGDKKRKPSRDFPAYAHVPLGKLHPNGVSKVRVDLNTIAASVPPMRDPFHILNFDENDSSSQFSAHSSAMSVDSISSFLSVDDSLMLANASHEDDKEASKLPKEQRPSQPADEREYFERMWSENFKNSEAQVQSPTEYLPVGAAGRLNRIKGYSVARDLVSHKLYAVFRLEIECIVSEKQWTVYRRFHDFKQLAHRLRNESVRISTVPTRTFMRSLDPTFLQKRQVELDRWLREILMLISLESCRVDTDRYAECCGSRGVHASVRLIRYFLTHEANEPPDFEDFPVPPSCSSISSSGKSFSNLGLGRPPLSSTFEQKTELESISHGIETLGSSCGRRTRAGSADQASISSRTGRSCTDYGKYGLSCVSRARGVSADEMPSVRKEKSAKLLSKEEVLDDRDSPFDALTVAEQRRSVILQDVEDETENNENISERRKDKVSLKQFDVLRMIGKGSFGRVLLVRKKNSSQLFAVKILSKPAIVQKQQVEHTRTERRVLASITHPFVVCLHYAFQTTDKLYFVLDYCPGGDLFFHLSRCGCFPEAMAKFYAAEIVLALIHLHEQGIVYRDLKPENIMLDVDGHVKLADFGLAKEGITSEVDGTHTMCGTPEYLPPEILNRAGHGTAVDWWNLGMVLYEMLTGRPPWYTQDRQELFNRLRCAELAFPPGLTPEAMNIIEGFLMRDPTKRLGAIDVREITYHPFFAEIDWNLLYNRQVQPLYRPCQYTDPIDAANFEEEFTKLPLAQIDSAGLSVATSELQGKCGNSEAPGRELADNVVANAEAARMGANLSNGIANSNDVSCERNSTLRNLSYTFAGFTYDGTNSSLAKSAN
ncbi:agc protein kinase [Plasmopara halstedii]|uniref:Agc protein kinase n=1 Tax=Plasmopara halstedii TaxID=4781 RepID=A0A0P1AMG9_PLAHL|nr:agc protein kinase [Plasmopara halstedii]CEG41937.1 agc protein kinase [Plasmopara halstedii]|eukprot:XP_024578306.1 agc protein kinase [Plasmopara halstedii]